MSSFLRNYTNPFTYLAPYSALTTNVSYYLATGVTISNSPSTISASENPIYWTFSANTIPVVGPYSGYAFTLLSLTGLTAGTQIVISAATAGAFPNYVFTAADEPQANEFYSTTTTPTKTSSEMVDSLCAAMNSNFSFRQRFQAIHGGGSIIYVQAVNSGATWNLNVGYSGVYSLYNSTSFISSERFKDWGLYTELYINSVGDFGYNNLNRYSSQRIATFENSYNTDNIYSFDVAGAVKNYVTTPVPTISASTMQSMSGALVNFYLVFSEKYDEYRTNYRREFLRGQTEIGWAMNSSLPFNTANTLTAYTINNSSAQTYINFLTQAPNPKNVYLNSNEYLYFLYSNNHSQMSNLHFAMLADVNYSDGTTDLALTLLQDTAIASNGGSLYSANVSPYQIFTGITYSSKLVKSYTVRLVFVSGAATYTVSNDKEYILLPDDASVGQKEILFQNSFGVYESFVFNGEYETDVERKVSTFNIPIPFGNGYTSYSTIDNIDVTQKYKSHSAHLDKEHFDWLFQLVKSNDVRLVVGNELKRIIITNADWKSISNSDLFKISIEWVYSLDENYIKN